MIHHSIISSSSSSFFSFFFLFLLLLLLGVATITILIIPPHYSATYMRYLCVSMTRAVRRLLLSVGARGIFNVRNDLSARCAHESETDTDEPTRVLTRKS